jgi:hypothetical protein
MSLSDRFDTEQGELTSRVVRDAGLHRQRTDLTPHIFYEAPGANANAVAVSVTARSGRSRVSLPRPCIYHGECVPRAGGTMAIKAEISGYSYRSYEPMRWVWRAQEVGTPGWARMKTGFRQTLRVDIDQSWVAHFRSDPRPALNRVYRVTAVLGRPIIYRIGVAYCAG